MNRSRPLYFRHFTATFISPLFAKKLRPIDLCPVLLVRFVSALGVFFELARTEPCFPREAQCFVRNILWPLRGHCEAGVRSVVLHSLFRILASSPSVEQIVGLGVVPLEDGLRIALRTWLSTATAEDANPECRVVSALLLRSL